MDMNRRGTWLGASGVALALGGFIAYSLVPDLLWLVTLLAGSGLVLIIVFLVLHFHTLRTFSARRSTRLGLNSLLLVIFVVGILGIVNFLAARHALRWDLSETKHFSLAPQTYRVLRTLSRDVTITVFTQERSPGFSVYRDLLDSYEHASPRVSVTFVDPERQPGLARQYGVSRLDTAVVESGPHTSRVTVASEAELTAALIRVSREGKKRILFLDGHGERQITDTERGGLSLMKDLLQKQGYEVSSLTLLKEAEIPSGTSVLVIAAPRRPVTREEQDRIAEFVKAGGRMLLFLDPETESRLEGLLSRWGLDAGPGVIVDLEDRLAQGDVTGLLVRTFTEHEITQDFTFAVHFPVARHFTFDEQRGAEWDYLPLARTSARSWAEMDPDRRVIRYDAPQDIQGPLAMAVVLTPKQAPLEGAQRAALVVVGNSSFASNAYINFPGNTDFLLHAIAWLAEERDLISITPKEPAFRLFIPNPIQERLLLYVQVLFLPAMTFLAGMLTWRRRRQL